MEPAHDDNIPGAPCLDRITFEAGKMGGRACIRGLRITVGTTAHANAFLAIVKSLHQQLSQP